MINRLFLLTSALFLVMGFFISAQSVSALGTCYPQINLVNQDPNPAVPGSYVKVLLEVSGVDNPDCKGFAVQISPQYPFSLDPGVSPIQVLNDSTYTPDFKTSWTVPFKLRVADDAIQGEYTLPIKSHTGTSRDFLTNPPMQLSYDNEVNITLTDALTSFATVVQDSSGSQVSIGVVNTGTNTANSMIVSIPVQDGYRATGSSQQIVGNLIAGDYTIVSFNVASTGTSTGGVAGAGRNFTRAGNFTRPAGNGSRQGFAGGGFGQANQTSGNAPLLIQLDYTDGIGKRRTVTNSVQLSNTLSGNSSRTSFGSARTSASSTSYSAWAYGLGGAIIGALLLFFIMRYQDKKKNVPIKSGHDKGTLSDPDWVAAERLSRKK